MTNDPSESYLQLLVSNLVNEKRFSHCRLCLKFIHKNFVQFHDLVTLNSSIGEFTPFYDVLTKMFGDNEMTEEIPGIDAVCPDCVESTLQALRFIESCKKSNETLHRVLNNLTDILNVDFDLSCRDQSMYIFVEDKESKLVLVRNDEEKEKLKSNKNQNIYECFECDEEFNSYNSLKDHNLSCHGHLTCEMCHETYANNVELIYHLNNVHKYKCSHCSERRDSEEQLQKHLENAHTLHTCKECGISCEGLDKLRTHEYKHKNYKKNQCAKCGKIYSTKEFYLKHVKLCLEDRIDPHPVRNEIVKSFFCNICGKGYSSSGGLRVHNRFAHGNAQHHVCNQCGKKFTAPSYLKTHMVTHTGEKNFKCDICSNRFVSKEALLYHTRRHTGEKPYSCKLCKKRFVNASARAEHVKFKHVGPTLQCEICSQKFVTPHFLKQHMNRHKDPTSKLYVARTLPPNMPGAENYKIKMDHNELL